MERGWHTLPPELLLDIFTHLPTTALVNATAVCTWWRAIARDDALWREVFMNEFHSFVSAAPVCDALADEYGMIKRGCPTALAEVVEDFYYELEDVAFSPQGSFYAVSGVNSMLCVYESTTRLLIEERDLQASPLRWTRISSLSFSPDEICLAVRGVRSNGKEEVATFAISVTDACLHFISRLPSTKCSAWFSNEWILSNDVYQMDLSSQFIKSISHLQLYKRHSTKREALLEPKTVSLMKLLNEEDEPFNFLVSPFVSRRFRRIINMAREAAMEGKTLSSKMNELDLIDQSVNEETQMDKLKQLLDRDDRCFECYISRDCEEECNCSCHLVRDEFLLIYGRHEDEIRSRICLHIIDLAKAIESDEKEDERRVVEEPTPEDDLFSYVSRQTSSPDHEIILDGRLLHLALSPDHKYLYATVNMSPRSASPLTEIRSFDLQTMVAERGVFYGGLAPFPNTATPTAANSAFLFSSTEEQVVVWSRVHHGPSLTRLSHPRPVRAIAAHPHAKLLLVACGEQLHVWTPAFS